MDSDEDVLYDEVGSGSENELDYGEDSESNNLEAKKSEEYPFQILSPDEIVQHMIDFIREVNSVLEMSETMTRILLNHFNWDKQKLLDRFYDGNQEKLFKEAHIVNPFKKDPPKKSSGLFCWQKSSDPATPQQQQSSSEGLEDCEVCYSSLPVSKLTGLQCDHRFCTDCWNNYLRVKIMDEGIVQTIACIADKCEILVDDTTVMKLVKDPKVKQKYQHLITNSFVDCNKLMRWCLTPGCNRAIKVQYVDAKPVTCICHLTFCFECGEKWHEPIGCDMLRKWEKKCKDDSETSNWIVAHTKDCPSCHSSIEKNGGCNHMTCRKCNKSFCWLCLSPMGGYNHGCNIYAEDRYGAIGTRDKTRAALERYLFYSNRYMNHMASFRFENELYTNVQYKMEDMEEHNMTWAEVQFLKHAVDTLVSCRQTLMYTYAFAYYLRKNNQTMIFEANQQDLEHAVEVLSEYLERDIAVENLVDIKQPVLDKYIYCENRRQALLQHVREGQEKEWWEYVGI